MSAAPVCRSALAEATRRWPNRNRASDGICADARHPSSSDHADPDRDGFCEAFDLTHDPAGGCDAHALVRAAVARRDRRIKYAISNGRIWSAARAGEGWRPYSGDNPHTRHAHVSTADAYRDDTSPWWSEAAAPTPQEDDMLQSDRDTLNAIATEVGKLAVVIRDPATGIGVDADALVASVARLEAKVDRIAAGGVDLDALAARVADELADRLAT